MDCNLIVKEIEKLFPLSKIYCDDKVGWQTNIFNREIDKVLVTLDINNNVVDYAIQNEYKFIIAHHPFFYFSTKKEEFLTAPYKKLLFQKLRKNGISVYILHSNFNNVIIGMPSVLGSFLNLDLYTPNTKNVYISFFKEPNQISFVEFVKKIKQIFELSSCEYYLPKDHNNLVKTFCFLPGRGGIINILNAWKYKPDLIITSDIKWSEWLTIKEENIPIMNISHFMEKIFAFGLKAILDSKFTNLIIDSFVDNNPVRNC